MNRVGQLASAVGCGLFAGLVGTAAMTVSSTVEMKFRRREPSTAPAAAAARVLGVEPRGEDERARFATVVHWGYGTGWGAVRGVLAALGLRGAKAAAGHFLAVWGTELVMLPALDVAPPPWEWGLQEVAIDAFHHGVYASATGAAFAALER